MTRLTALKGILIYVVLTGVVPILIVAICGFIGHLLDVYVVGTGYLMACVSAISGIAIGLAISVRFQGWFEKKLF